MTGPPRRYSWEDYLYPPNADGVQILRNRPGLTSVGEWFQAERQLSFLRHQELIAQPALVARTFDAAHWMAIHHHLFQDMYEWAGEFRTVGIAKGSSSFVPPGQLEFHAEEYLTAIRAANMFAGRDRAGVVEGLAGAMQALNIIHPFREGNGRTQRILTEHIAEHAGYLLDWHRIGPDEQNLVMELAFDGELEPLHDALERAVLPILRGGSSDNSPWPTEPTGPARAPTFWQLDRTGRQVLTDARAQAPEPGDTTAAPRGAAAVDQQHDHGR